MIRSTIHSHDSLISLRLAFPSVEGRLQYLTGFECQDPSWRDLNVTPCLGITAPPCPLFPDDEIPKTGDLDLILLLKACFHDIKDRLHNLCHLFL